MKSMRCFAVAVWFSTFLMACGSGSGEPETTDAPATQLGGIRLGSPSPVGVNQLSIEASIAALYRTAFGPENDAGVLDFWFDLGRGGASLIQIANSLTASELFIPMAQKSDEAFVQALYQNALGQQGDAAGVTFWTDALGRGETRADLLLQFSRVAGLSEVERASLCLTERLPYWCEG